MNNKTDGSIEIRYSELIRYNFSVSCINRH